MVWRRGIFSLFLFIFLLLLWQGFDAGAAEVLEQAGSEGKQNIFSTSLQVDDTEWVEEKTGSLLDLTLRFTDSKGVSVALADIIDKPTILLPIYFYCPNICSQNLANLALTLHRLSGIPGVDYKVIAVSFNHREDAEIAANAKENYLKLVGDDFPEEQWKFLTGNEAAIKVLTEQLGFRFQELDDTTFIHPAALMIIDRQGKIIRYIYGSFLPGDIDLGIQAAAKGETLLSVRRLLNFCFNYDPEANQGLFKMAKIGILVFFGLVLACVFLFVRRSKRSSDKTST